MKIVRLLVILGITAFLLLPFKAAKANPLGTVDIADSSLGAYSEATVYGGGYAGQGLYTGVYMLDKTSGTDAGTLWANGPVPGFCIELEVPAPHAPTTYDVINVSESYLGLLNESMGSDKSNYLSELWGRYYDPSWADGSYTSADNNAAAAFAAAVWEVVYEDLPASTFDWDVTSDGTPGIPGFSTASVDYAVANAWLASLDGSGPMAELAVFAGEGSQNYLVAVPEPTTMLLLGVGGLVGAMRRKKRMA
ncbi:MAG: PEP-CTERM sorting domain-containing protein [Phycisphaerae bacterium]|nr:PEP-CTERM sorting domain-containing protein [Phycisphaerae bacterium]